MLNNTLKWRAFTAAAVRSSTPTRASQGKNANQNYKKQGKQG
jgi:hypothetical protein